MQQGAREQRCNDEAHQERRGRAELNGVVDQPPTSFQDFQLAHDCSCMRWFWRLQSLLKHPGSINDASEAPAQHVQQSADSRQKEYGSDRKLNDVRDLINLIHGYLPVSAGAIISAYSVGSNL